MDPRGCLIGFALLAAAGGATPAAAEGLPESVATAIMARVGADRPLLAAYGGVLAAALVACGLLGSGGAERASGRRRAGFHGDDG